MSRRVRKSSAVALLALTLTLSVPSAFAGIRAPTFDGPEGTVERIVRVAKKFVKALKPASTTEEPSALPRPPIP
jgi:hypothetical protein